MSSEIGIKRNCLLLNVSLRRNKHLSILGNADEITLANANFPMAQSIYCALAYITACV